MRADAGVAWLARRFMICHDPGQLLRTERLVSLEQFLEAKIAHICRFVDAASSQRGRRKIGVKSILRNFDGLHSPGEEGIRVEKHIAITLRTANLTSSVGEF